MSGLCLVSCSSVIWNCCNKAWAVWSSSVAGGDSRGTRCGVIPEATIWATVWVGFLQWLRVAAGASLWVWRMCYAPVPCVELWTAGDWHGLLDARWALGFYDRRPNIIIKIKKKTSNQLMAPRPPGTDSEFAIWTTFSFKVATRYKFSICNELHSVSTNKPNSYYWNQTIALGSTLIQIPTESQTITWAESIGYQLTNLLTDILFTPYTYQLTPFNGWVKMRHNEEIHYQNLCR
jgi:hypothetical protein